MALANDLLHQAHHLALLDRARPKQASLRRAISTAYYALFHLLVAAAVRLTVPIKVSGLPARVARAISHTEIAEVCRLIQRPNPGVALQQLQPHGFPLALQEVAKAFVDLQDQRHRADYDLAANFNRPDTMLLVQQAEAAFAAWAQVEALPEAHVFLCAILFAKRWSK